MINVLHFVSIPAKTSGVMSILMNYYRHMDRTKIQFDFLCFIKPEATDSWEEEIERLGGHLYFIPKPGKSHSVQALKDFFRSHRGYYSIMQNHEVYLTWLLRPVSMKYGNIGKFIVQCHATRYSDKGTAAFRNRLFCLPIRHMKGISRAACSRAAGEFLFGKSETENGNVFIMINAVEPERFRFSQKIREAERRKYGIRESDVLLGNVGRMVPQKNQEFLLVLLEKLLSNDQKRSYKLMIVGNGPLEKKLIQSVHEKKLEANVIFTGRLERVESVLCAMDLFLLPSIYEGLPVSQIEAESSGLKCLVSDQVTREAEIGPFSKYIPLDEKIWTETIGEISMGGENADRAGATEYIRAAGFDIEGAVRQYEKYMERLASNG